MKAFDQFVVRHARKAHKCEWCGQPILVGAEYAHYVGKWEGEFMAYRVHPECREAMGDEDLADGFTPFEGERPIVYMVHTGIDLTKLAETFKP